MEFLP